MLERAFVLSQKQTLFVSLIALLTVAFFYILFLLSQRIKRHGEATIALVDGLLYDQSLEHISADSLESLYLQQQLAKITKPEFSDKNYHDMVASFQDQLKVLADTNGVAYWQFFAKQESLSKSISSILLNEDDKGSKIKASWRGYFSKKSVKAIISLAKEVKKEQKPRSLNIDTCNNENILLSLCYQQGQWFGTLADTKKNNQLQLKISALEAEVIRQNKAFFLQDKQKKQKLNEMLVQAMLQSQARSCHAESSMQEYQQLAKILEWLRQQQIITLLENNGKAINLTEVNFFDEVYAAVINGMCEAGQHKNKISLSLDEKILPQIKQDARLFQRLIIALLRLMLNQQIKASSVISFTLINRSSNQQTIKVVTQLIPSENNNNVPIFIDYLLENEKYKDANTPDFIHYFQVLLASLHGTNVSMVALPKGFELSFELAIETLNQQVTKLECSHLTQDDVLCIYDENKQAQIMGELFKDKPTCQYVNTHVELLLAVSKPDEHLTLLTVLHWYGFQVRVVSSAQAMKKHWQTGRYLILLNAFELSPFIELAVGRTVSRGVFNFPGIENGILSDSQQKLSKNWVLGNLPSKLDLIAIESLLKPWLKEKKALVDKNITIDVTQKPMSVVGTSHVLIDEIVSNNPEQALAPAFDMLQYTANQGGPEFAVYMLDEYLESNQESLAQLGQAVAAENAVIAQQALEQLVKNAQILAAQKTIVLCSLLSDALRNKNVVQMQSLLNDLTDQLSLVDAYAKTI
jgi:HPt (histidine-containing phosphotransfer) domain-containing protein